MSNRLWQRCMIGLARSSRAKQLFTAMAGRTQLAQRFVAVGSAADAAARMVTMKRECGALASLFYLGEYVYDAAAVSETIRAQHDAVSALLGAGLQVHVSADATQIGLMIDKHLAAENARGLAGFVREVSLNASGSRNVVMIDMEDHTTVEDTWNLYRNLLAEGLPLAITLQAYLLRTASDLRSLLGGPNMVRLVKGAFVADADVAYTRKSDILENYRALLQEMFAPLAREAGFRPVVATHDPEIHEYAIGLAEANGWAPEQWEFEVLLGIAESRTKKLLQRGFTVRLYTPFGHDWWPYAIRRVGEHPRYVKLLFS